MPHRVIKTIAGRRGSALTLFGFTFTPIAFSQVVARPETRTVALQWMPDWITIDLLGWVFMVASVGALVAGMFSGRLPHWCLSLGYGLAVLPPAILTVVYGVAFCITPWMGGAVSFAIFAGYTSLIYLISGWEETRPSPPMTDEQRKMLGGEVQ